MAKDRERSSSSRMILACRILIGTADLLRFVGLWWLLLLPRISSIGATVGSLVGGSNSKNTRVANGSSPVWSPSLLLLSSSSFYSRCVRKKGRMVVTQSRLGVLVAIVVVVVVVVVCLLVVCVLEYRLVQHQHHSLLPSSWRNGLVCGLSTTYWTGHNGLSWYDTLVSSKVPVCAQLLNVGAKNEPHVVCVL